MKIWFVCFSPPAHFTLLHSAFVCRAFLIFKIKVIYHLVWMLWCVVWILSLVLRISSFASFSPNIRTTSVRFDFSPPFTDEDGKDGKKWKTFDGNYIYTFCLCNNLCTHTRQWIYSCVDGLRVVLRREFFAGRNTETGWERTGPRKKYTKLHWNCDFMEIEVCPGMDRVLSEYLWKMCENENNDGKINLSNVIIYHRNCYYSVSLFID